MVASYVITIVSRLCTSDITTLSSCFALQYRLQHLFFTTHHIEEHFHGPLCLVQHGHALCRCQGLQMQCDCLRRTTARG
jgi:hypothetical protein